jgi:hypothetical protein
MFNISYQRSIPETDSILTSNSYIVVYFIHKNTLDDKTALRQKCPPGQIVYIAWVAAALLSSTQYEMRFAKPGSNTRHLKEEKKLLGKKM